MATATASPLPVRDPARPILLVGGAAWAVTFLFTLLGGSQEGAHDYVIEQSPWPWPVRLAAFLAVWLVMVAAMMLPSTIPMARMFTAVSRSQAGRVRAAFYASYVGVWSLFALGALVADTRVHWAVHRWSWLEAHEGVILAGTLLVAGGYELSPLKDACLRACRTPLGIVGRHYRRGLGGGVRVGLAHAASCLGCCWALMLVMFGTGVGSLVWMLGLTAVMTVQKVSPRYGAALVRPTAAALLAGGSALMLAAVV